MQEYAGEQLCLPFTFKGEIHNKCTTSGSDNGAVWCVTEVDRNKWRKVRRRLNGPTEGDLNRVGGFSSPVFSGQPNGQVVENREVSKLITTLEGGLLRGGLEVKVKVGNGLGYRSSAGLLEDWLGKSKVKEENCAKDGGGPDSCLGSKGAMGVEDN